jgi:hypothetical protein
MANEESRTAMENFSGHYSRIEMIDRAGHSTKYDGGNALRDPGNHQRDRFSEVFF